MGRKKSIHSRAAEVEWELEQQEGDLYNRAKELIHELELELFIERESVPAYKAQIYVLKKFNKQYIVKIRKLNDEIKKLKKLTKK